MHAEVCPICQGEGLICDVEPDETTGVCPRYHVCNGCQGKGWISVADTDTEEEVQEGGDELGKAIDLVMGKLPSEEEKQTEPELEGEDTEDEPTESEFEGEDE